MYETKQWQHYKDLAEWMAVKLADNLKADKSVVQWIATELADAYNTGWNDSAKDIGKFRR